MTDALTLTDIEELAGWALDENGLTEQGWRFRWDQATRRFGCCKYRARLITLSKPIFRLAANQDEALDTILHEVAHALAGPAADHGPVWKATAARLGARPSACATITERPPFTVLGACGCGPERHGRYRLPDQWRINGYRCRPCGELIVWRRA